MLILFDVPAEIVGNLNIRDRATNVSEDTLIEVMKYIDNGVIILDGASNGDIIKAMFPNAKTWVVNEDMAVEFPEMLTIRLFPLVWWNAPYKEKTHDSNNRYTDKQNHNREWNDVQNGTPLPNNAPTVDAITMEQISKYVIEINKILEEEKDDARWCAGLRYSLRVLDKYCGKEQ